MPRTKIQTVTVVNPHYIGEIKMNEAFEHALAIDAQNSESKIKTAG